MRFNIRWHNGRENYMREIVPVIETVRLQLREFVPEDLDALALVLSDPVAMRFYPSPFDSASVAEWIERNRHRYKEDGHGLWAMVLKSSGELIGDCGLVMQKVEGISEVEIGYHVQRALWGKGLATEAAMACRDYGFERLNVGRLISLIRPENLSSRRVAEKNGMSVWKEVTHANLPHLVYAIRREDLKT
jgi:ribosomal-protein-alanine N-acetyltransferase